jgi:thioredoxin-like negative regulator of GroEL
LKKAPALRIELAAVAVLRGDNAGALEWLSRAYDAGFRDYGTLEPDPIFVAVRGDARFRELLERMRKDVAAQRSRARERGLLDIDSLLAPRK